jgi:hypothetical protein
MAEGQSSLITIVGGAYFHPITDLLVRLKALPSPTEDNQIKTGGIENGYSAALCILSVVCLESYLMRMRYATQQTVRNQTHSVLDVFCSVHADFTSLDELTEVYVIRDLLVHNHLWEIQYQWDASSPMDLVEAVRSFIKRDAKYDKSVDLDNYQTKKLKLHIFPTRIDRHDAAKVLSTLWNTLLYLERCDRNQCYVSHLYVKKDGISIKFGEVIKEFCTDILQGTLLTKGAS